MDIQGTRTLWQSGKNYTQYVTLLPPNAKNANTNYFYPNSNQYIFDTKGISFTSYPATPTTSFTLTNFTSGAFRETGFLNGMMAVVPNQTCFTWPQDQAKYYGNPQLVNYAYSFTVGSSTSQAVVAGTITVDVGRLVTSLADNRAMYRILTMTGNRTMYTYSGGAWSATGTVTTVALSTGVTQNLIFLPSTGFVYLPASTVLLDIKGLTYVSNGNTYTLMSNATSGYVRETDTAGNDVNFSGSLSLCMNGLACPVSFPIQVCMQYAAVDSQPGVQYSNYNTSMQATLTINSSGIITAAQGTRFVKDSSAGYYQLISLLNAGVICYGSGCTDNTFALTSMPFFTGNGWAYTAYPDYYTFGQGSVWVAGTDNFNTVAEDPIHAQYGPSSYTGGPCSNYQSVQWYYPGPVYRTAQLTYNFTTGTGANMLNINTSLTMMFDASRQTAVPYGPVCAGCDVPMYNSMGFTVLNASGTRIVSHGNGVRNVSAVAQLLPQCRYDSGWATCNQNVLFGSYPNMTRLAYMVNGSDSTGTSTGLPGAVEVSYNVTKAKLVRSGKQCVWLC